MHWAVNNVQVFLAQNNVLIYHSLLNSLQVVPVHLTTNDVDEFLIAFKLNVLNLNLVYLVDNTLIVWSQHLSTIVPICLISVILTWVVRCCYVYTCLASELTDSKRNLWCRTQTLEQVNLDTISRENISYCFSKHTSVVTAVMTYYNRTLLTRECFQDIVCKTLCSHTNNVLVHAVGTCAHNTAKATCTKLKILIESIDQRCLVSIVKHSLYFLTCLLIKGGRKPFFSPCLALSNQLCIVCHNLNVLLL